MEMVIQQQAEEQARQVERMRSRFNELMTIAYCEAIDYLESGDFLSQMRPQDVDLLDAANARAPSRLSRLILA
jgi:hypothetical protein